MSTFLTVFTPTYNRAHTLPRLYASLCSQSCKDFVWLVVDDGSTDGTRQLIAQYIAEKKISIQYYFQENQGKPAAHNFGVAHADAKLFADVDSDDWLPENAVQRILEIWKEQEAVSHGAIGILGKRGENIDGHVKAITKWNGGSHYSTLLEAHRKYGLVGDTILVFRTDILQQVEFPRFEGESFVPESYLYDRLDQMGPLFLADEILYLCEYQSDGLTAHMHEVNAKNPKGYEAYISQRLQLDRTFKERLSDTIRYVSIQFVLGNRYIIKGARYKGLAFPGLFLGYLRYKVLYAKYTV